MMRIERGGCGVLRNCMGVGAVSNLVTGSRGAKARVLLFLPLRKRNNFLFITFIKELYKSTHESCHKDFKEEGRDYTLHAILTDYNVELHQMSSELRLVRMVLQLLCEFCDMSANLFTQLEFWHRGCQLVSLSLITVLACKLNEQGSTFFGGWYVKCISLQNWEFTLFIGSSFQFVRMSFFLRSIYCVILLLPSLMKDWVSIWRVDGHLGRTIDCVRSLFSCFCLSCW